MTSAQPATPGESTMKRLQASTVTGEGRNLHLLSRLAAMPGWRAVDRPLKILSFGCSTGHECLDIQSVFPDARVFGCDVNPEALAEAVARCGPSITIFESSAQALAEHGPFDLVTAFNVFCRYPTTEGKDQIASHFPMSALDEGLTTVDACIRPGGLLAIYNTPYFFEQTCLAAAYEPAPGQDFPDNGWMAKCDADGRRLTTVSVLCEGALHAVPDYARGLRDGRLAWPFGDQRVSVCQQPASEQALPGSTRIVAWRKRSRLDMPVVISFFAGDRYYHDAAAVLRADCERLGLDSDIVELSLAPGVDWIAICRRKAAFYDQMLRKHRRPVLWMDVDCRLAQRPDFLAAGPADFAAFLRDFRYLRDHDPAASPRCFHPAILYFNHTPAGLAFAALIARIEAEHPELVATDDYFLEEAWQRHAQALNLLLFSPGQVGFEWPLQRGQTFYFGRSGQVSHHIGRALQHAVPLFADARRKAVLQREAGELGRTSRPEEALVMLRRAHEIDPTDASLALRLARLLQRLGRAAEAIAVMQAVTARCTDGIDHATRFLAETDHAAGRLDQAAAVLGRLAGGSAPEDRAWAQSRLLRVDLDQRARRLAIPEERRPALWWMETPYPGNVGDILNPYVVEKLSGVPPRWVSRGQGILAIGSVVKFAQAGTVVWGSGTPRMTDQLNGQATYRAVRGPLTRELVRRSGAECPETFGDPACFLPRLYRPRPLAGRRRLGLIPHFSHADALHVGDGVALIPVLRAGYAGIEAFIDEVCACDAVLTTSLHGLIISHAYGIPARWCDVPDAADGLPGDGTKFHDYMLSVGLPLDTPLALRAGSVVTLDWAAQVGPLPPKPIDLRRLAMAAPFPILDSVLRQLDSPYSSEHLGDMR